MNWLRNLLRRPAPTRAAQIPPGRTAASAAAAPAIDIGRLRQALAAASAAERGRCERDLGRALALARQTPAADDAPGVWIEAICQVADKPTALAWAQNVAGDPSLAELAMHARFAEVRLAVAQRIADSAFLERVAEASRDRDKRVYRHCSDLLRERRQGAERARRAADLAQALRQLLAASPLPVSRLLDLEKDLRSLGAGEQEVAECTALVEQARARTRDEAQALRDLQSQAAAAAALLAEVSADPWPLAERLDDWRGRAAALGGPLPDWLAGQANAQALHRTMQDVALLLAERAQDLERAQECERFLAGVASGEAVAEETTAAWEALPKPANTDARARLESAWIARQPVSAAAPEPAVEVPPPAVEAPPPPARPRVDEEAVHQLLDKLEDDLEQGHLADADAADKRIEQLTHGAALPGALARRLQRARAQLSRLRGWARWGTDQVREHLIAEAEALLAAEPDIEERARAVPALRQEWKRLDAHGPAAKVQWERFDSALSKAYEPVAEHRAQEMARHEAARAAKEQLCAEWEAWLAGIVWEHADYKVVQARRQEILVQWRAAPPAGFRDERQLRKRLDALVAAIDARLGEARTQEIERREQLIAAVEALRDAPDVGRATTEAKALQERWREQAGGARLGRGEEQQFWQRFRAACDAVFARRDAQRAEQTAQREGRIQARQGLLDGLEAVLTATDAGAIEAALAQFRSSWSAGEPASRPAEDRLAAAARDLMQQAEQRIEALRAEKHSARFDLMAQKAALAQRVESAAAGGGETQDLAAEVRQAWDSLDRLPGKAERALAERLAAAAAATPAALAQGRETREALLLDLEIALGLPSPEPYGEARRERQLGSLQHRFKGGEAQTQDPEDLVVRWYATAAAPDEGQEERMAGWCGIWRRAGAAASAWRAAQDYGGTPSNFRRQSLGRGGCRECEPGLVIPRAHSHCGSRPSSHSGLAGPPFDGLGSAFALSEDVWRP